MIDMEKVIKGLEQCIKVPYVCDADCPYYNTSLCREQLQQDALALLKEQEAVSSEALKAHYGKMYKCKGCGLEWYQQTQRYCQHCGKAVRF